MSRFFRRATLEPVKFSYEVTLLAIERLPPSLPDSTVVIRWQRGSKRGGTCNDVFLTKSGGAVCQKFELKATMFRDDKSLKYDSKVLSFSFSITNPQSASSKTDSCSFDLASLQLDECSGACARLALSGGGALDGALLSLKIVPKLRVAGQVGSSGARASGDASDASDASVMSHAGGGGGSDGGDSDGAGVSADASRPEANCTNQADADDETAAQQHDTLALGQLKLAAARRKAAAAKYAAGDGASGDDHEARAAQHEVQATHHRQLAAALRAGAASQAVRHADVQAAGGSGDKMRRASGGRAGAAGEADPHNKFKGRYVTDKRGSIVRAEERARELEGATVAADYAMGSAAAAAASGVVLACNGMADDAPPDAPGNENSASGGGWWCGGCL
jgi:hypothetical protein